MGAIKDLMIGVMCFADMLSYINRKKLQKYRKEMADLRTEKFLNEFNIVYEKGLLKEITEYISYDDEDIPYDMEHNKIVDLVMHHNSWNDLRDL